MSRVKEFDPDQALGAAMRLFWQRGYEATSMADLVDATGVARASLYATFGSKHDLYVRALDRYVGERDPLLVERLAGPGPVLPAIKAVLDDFAADTESAGELGCFVVNAAVERMPADLAVALSVETSWETLEVALTSALVRARGSGELVEAADPRRLARFLLVILEGLRVVGKGRTGAVRARDAADEAFAALTRWLTY
ncbi:TetR/AcrR family transcriptional regulator [Actinoplanes couchii]|uniref:TetR family transcriptional regulator n=1 Tax=Actinoplanes couchii TaxID=403638 RepID=A0ABQ3XQM5_9ACTN|nr:TetR/AcrR family transcriptional regulator [Actinoplanes couchii]MDR6318796.1 TetR/AcrR family transcriptional repressor of nem operon [Actinoplanes couchii]GID60827.1 TetR family transcriptional regulator [Actinoplanes couchii]